MSITTNKRTILQVDIKPELKKLAEEKAERQGFSSIQEVVRVFMTGYVRNDFWPLPKPRPTEETIKRWDEEVESLKKDIKQRKAKSYSLDNIDDFFGDLEKGI